MADVLKHAFDLMLPSFMNRDFNPGISWRFSSFFHFGWSGMAIFQGDTTTKLLEVDVLQYALHFYEIGFLNVIGWMETGLGDIPVIRQE